MRLHFSFNIFYIYQEMYLVCLLTQSGGYETGDIGYIYRYIYNSYVSVMTRNEVKAVRGDMAERFTGYVLHSMCIWSKLLHDKAFTDVSVSSSNGKSWSLYHRHSFFPTWELLPAAFHLTGFPPLQHPDRPRQGPDWSTNTGWQVYREKVSGGRV